MAKFRTKKDERTTYIYKDAYGKKVFTVRPGDAGVNANGEVVVITDEDIAILHRMDDDVINAEKRDSYHGLLHYEQMGNYGGAYEETKQADLTDHNANPERLFIAAIEATERSGALADTWASLSEAQQELIIKKLCGLTNVAIAVEENVSEAAIRNRLKKIQKKFEKFLS